MNDASPQTAQPSIIDRLSAIGRIDSDAGCFEVAKIGLKSSRDVLAFLKALVLDHGKEKIEACVVQKAGEIAESMVDEWLDQLPFSVRIEELALRFGAAPGRPATIIAPSAMTLFVGPNNSGKSKILQEIHQRCCTGEHHHTAVIVNDVLFHESSPRRARQLVESLKVPPLPQESLPPEHAVLSRFDRRHTVHLPSLFEAIRRPNTQVENFCRSFLSFCVLFLDGSTRLNLANETAATDLQAPAKNIFDILFRDDALRGEVRRICYDAFKLFFVVDPTALGRLRARLSKVAAPSTAIERGLTGESVAFHGQATLVAGCSDGVKAFTGIISQIVAGDPTLIFIDEPEAFLHPGLAFKLGKEIALSANSSMKQVFASTHSVNFVMGCIQSGTPLNIVRLTYHNDVPTARTLPNDKILRMMRNPLLRSTGVLDGIFYDCIMVMEADSDRAFYQEINERLLRVGAGRGIPNCLFINAQNKQTIRQIIKPLRELGIPAAAVVDIDVIKDGGKDWSELLDAAFVPTGMHPGLSQTRIAIKSLFETAGKDMKKDGGIHALNHDDAEAASSLFEQLDQYGVFAVRGGELESWLPNLGLSGHGPQWLIKAFERMGEDPGQPTYIRPADNDVWGFVDSIGRWLLNSKRRGIPS